MKTDKLAKTEKPDRKKRDYSEYDYAIFDLILANKKKGRLFNRK